MGTLNEFYSVVFELSMYFVIVLFALVVATSTSLSMIPLI